MNNLLDIYLRDIRVYPLLSNQEEQALVQRVQAGDAAARKQLIESHLILVVHIARQYQHTGVEMLDLIQEGNIGLMKAVDMFDPKVGNRLSTLAMYWIQKYILRFLRDEQDETVSLDMEISERGETLLLSDTIEDKSTLLGEQTIKNIESMIEHEELQRCVHGLLSKLSPREQQVLQLLYGLGDYPRQSRMDTAKVIGLQADQVSRIKTRALKHLKEAMETNAMG